MRIRDLALNDLAPDASPAMSAPSSPTTATLSTPVSFRELLRERSRGERDEDEQLPAVLDGPAPTDEHESAVRTLRAPLDRAATPDPILHPIVRAIAVAVDQHRRRVVLMRIEICGQRVGVRVRQTASGSEVSLNTEHAGLRAMMRERADELCERCERRGLALRKLEIT